MHEIRSTSRGFYNDSNHGIEKRLVAIPEVATILAISNRTAWRLVSKGELETVHIGRSVRVTRESIEAFIRKGGAR